jgi:hypothetical protein
VVFSWRVYISSSLPDTAACSIEQGGSGSPFLDRAANARQHTCYVVKQELRLRETRANKLLFVNYHFVERTISEFSSKSDPSERNALRVNPFVFEKWCCDFRLQVSVTSKQT